MFFPFDRLILEICIANDVPFRSTPGVLMIPLSSLETVLGHLPADGKVLGFSTFTLAGSKVIAHLDFDKEFYDGVSPPEALAAISDWPSDLDRWIEIVGLAPEEPA